MVHLPILSFLSKMEISGTHISYCDTIIKTERVSEINLPSFDLYEVIRIIDKTPVFLEEHLKRLNISLKKKKGIYIPEIHLIKNSIHNYLLELNIVTGNIAILFSSATSEYIIHALPFKYPTNQEYLHGVKSKTYQVEREFPAIKQINVNESVKHKISHLLENKDIYEILLVNRKGNITEGSKSNLFFIRNNKLYTAAESTILKGITREKILDCCKNLKIDVSKIKIPLSSIMNYQAAFITGTSAKVLPLNQIDDIAYNSNHILIKKIQQEYESLIQKEVKSHL